MKTRILLPALLLAAVFVSPASANWFSNPDLNINLNIGSAPSPTPDDVLGQRRPTLVRDADGNIIAMIDPATGKVIATVEPGARPNGDAAKNAPVARAR
jgi:YVTN family beta-propeller protein